jgi:two-component system nitrogen regulation sensor histidine kinase NtrY
MPTQPASAMHPPDAEALPSAASGKVLARRHPRQRLPLERRLRLLSAAMLLPGSLVTFALLLHQHVSPALALGIAVLVALPGLLAAAALLEQVVRPLQTLSNVIGALREEDYGFRARGAGQNDALGELAREINALAQMLREQRVGGMEAAALLRRVVDSIDAPVLAFDPSGTLRMLNPSAERAFGLSSRTHLGRDAADLHLAGLLAAPDESVIVHEHEGRPVRWVVHRTAFRQRGVPQTLLLLSDVSAALREEERQAWRRLIRVLGHEINNSLAPIKSIAGSLRAQLASPATEDDVLAGDLERGLSVIEGRAESLHRFVQAYRQLAQLPPPSLRPTALGPLLERTLALEQGHSVTLLGGPAIAVRADPDQLEQMFINLIRNAVEAAALPAEARGDWTGDAEPEKPCVLVGWRELLAGMAEVWIDDNGPGLTNSSNLFVPFYTTKPGGTGVGLALARQIAEAHGGTLELRNREEGGCRATVTLPVSTRGTVA